MKRTQATAIGSLSILLWGTLALLTQLTENQVPPFQLLAMTFATAWLLMLIKGVLLGPSPRQLLRQPAAAWALGVGGLFGYHACYFAAMALAPAVEVSLLAYLWPLLIVLLSALLPGHRLLWVHVAGALVAMAGCWLLLDRGEGGFQWRYWPGYALALGCAFLWSGYSVLSRLLAQVKGEAPADAVGWYCAVTALLGLICHLLWESWVWPQGIHQWLGILGLGLGPVGIAFFTWDYGIKRGDLRLLGVLAYGAPLVSTLLLVVFGYAESSWSLVLSSLLIVGGALLAGAGPLWQARKVARRTEQLETP
ncbi:aromatic amino acid exporter YddG [Microbulbifer thermotolerans]|uniref:aromatic amino acid exporter YddG n=1 Tax=Microbulbifer thermotolerans TaxID=252514 RepID=UPI0009EE2B1A|nr:EamA family transporter [Microbulbifer thermotolerans]MCX2795435.1 EamA family transporter [Microbulbifer thermotolerans]MCX2835484.1 EamA family transporter [Microbulbifer thermotolerans]